MSPVTSPAVLYRCSSHTDFVTLEYSILLNSIMPESKVLSAIAKHINSDLEYVYNPRDIIAGEEFTLEQLQSVLDKLADSGYINQHVPNRNFFTITEEGLRYLSHN